MRFCICLYVLDLPTPRLAEGKKKKKKSSSGPKAPKKKGEGGSGGKVLITRMSRNKRKSVTVVTGLDTYPGACVRASVPASVCPVLEAADTLGHMLIGA